MDNNFLSKFNPVNGTIAAVQSGYPLMVALTSDGVPPIARIQIEELGDHFHVNGPEVDRVIDHLQRRRNFRLLRAGLTVGWHKGDTAFECANSAGGQAASLLSLCLLGLYNGPEVGYILHQLSLDLLPQGHIISGAGLLQSVAELLALKTARNQFLKFWNKMIGEVEKHYKKQKETIPTNFYDRITTDAAVGLLSKISEAMLAGNSRVRITGISGMGSILGIVLFLFPRNALITLDDVVSHTCDREIFIMVDVADTGVQAPSIEIQDILVSPVVTLLRTDVGIDRSSSHAFRTSKLFCWKGWLALRLSLCFRVLGRECSQDILQACCDLLKVLGLSFNSGGTLGRVPQLEGATPLLECLTLDKMDQVCNEVFEIGPQPLSEDCRSAFDKLLRAFQICGDLLCSCRSGRSSLRQGWPQAKPRNSPKGETCFYHRLWDDVGRTINDGFACMFVEADLAATVGSGTSVFATDVITKYLNHQCDWTLPSDKVLWELAFGLQGLKRGMTKVIALSTGSSTMYPKVLETVQIPSKWSLLFKLVDGRLYWDPKEQSGGKTVPSERKTYLRLDSVVGRQRTKIDRCSITNLPEIKPSDHGTHTILDIDITSNPGEEILELHTRAMVEKMWAPVDLKSCCEGFFRLGTTDYCEHSTTERLDPLDAPEGIPTDVARPCARKQENGKPPKIGIAMTKGNRTAQFLCCVGGYRAILMENCCLNCAFKEARGFFHTIIIR